MNSENTQPILVEKPSGPRLITPLTWILVGTSIGLMLAALVLPIWLPGLIVSVLGSDPKVFWYLSRATAIVAFVILWFSMAWGLLLTGRLAQFWPNTAVARDLHEFTSLLGLGIGFFHGVILMGDHYIHFSLVQVLLPFSTSAYKPLWVGLGQVTFYLWMILIITHYVRSRIGKRAWRLIHYGSFLAFILAMIHGLMSGSDAQIWWMQLIYWISGASLLFLSIYRIVFTFEQKRQQPIQRIKETSG